MQLHCQVHHIVWWGSRFTLWRQEYMSLLQAGVSHQSMVLCWDTAVFWCVPKLQVHCHALCIVWWGSRFALWRQEYTFLLAVGVSHRNTHHPQRPNTLVLTPAKDWGLRSKCPWLCSHIWSCTYPWPARSFLLGENWNVKNEMCLKECRYNSNRQYYRRSTEYSPWHGMDKFKISCNCLFLLTWGFSCADVQRLPPLWQWKYMMMIA